MDLARLLSTAAAMLFVVAVCLRLLAAGSRRHDLPIDPEEPEERPPKPTSLPPPPPPPKQCGCRSCTSYRPPRVMCRPEWDKIRYR